MIRIFAIVLFCAGWAFSQQTQPTKPNEVFDEISKSGQYKPAGEIKDLIGQDLSNWRQPIGDWMLVGKVEMDAAKPTALKGADGQGILLNGKNGRTRDLLTAVQFGDIAVHVEFMIPGKSNSGVYFMGRYELQVYDSFGVLKDQYPGIECGGLYPRWMNNHEVEGHSPRVNASLPPGQWQSFDVIFETPRFDADGKKTANAKFVKVVHNGIVIHENVERTGPTRAAAFNDEKPTGPLMFQGDHGPVAYRNLRVLELKPD